MSDDDRKFYQKIEKMYFQLRISEEKSKRRLEVSNHLKFVINQSTVQRRVQHQYRRANSAAPALVTARMYDGRQPPRISKQYSGLSIPAAIEVRGGPASAYPSARAEGWRAPPPPWPPPAPPWPPDPGPPPWRPQSHYYGGVQPSPWQHQSRHNSSYLWPPPAPHWQSEPKVPQWTAPSYVGVKLGESPHQSWGHVTSYGFQQSQWQSSHTIYNPPHLFYYPTVYSTNNYVSPSYTNNVIEGCSSFNMSNKMKPIMNYECLMVGRQQQVVPPPPPPQLHQPQLRQAPSRSQPPAAAGTSIASQGQKPFTSCLSSSQSQSAAAGNSTKSSVASSWRSSQVSKSKPITDDKSSSSPKTLDFNLFNLDIKNLRCHIIHIENKMANVWRSVLTKTYGKPNVQKSKGLIYKAPFTDNNETHNVTLTLYIKPKDNKSKLHVQSIQWLNEKFLVNEIQGLYNKVLTEASTSVETVNDAPQSSTSAKNSRAKQSVANPVQLPNSIEVSTKPKALPSKSKASTKVSVANSIRLLRRKNKNKASSDTSNKIINEKLLIYSCNVRSIGNKKKSLEQILEDNSIDIAILQELNVKNMHYFKGYTQFNYISNRKFHGISLLAKNFYKNKIMRIPHEPEENFEIVHVILKDTIPLLNIMGVYMDVETRQTVEKIESSWLKITKMVEEILERGESITLLGDFNRPINPEVKNESSGTKLLNSWVESEQVILANNRNIHTRIDPHTGKGSTLDLALVSKNIETCVSQFRVDTDRKITPFSIRNIKGQVLKRHTDHLAITLSLNIIKRKELKAKKVPMINFSNQEGWLNYPDISNRYADKIKEIVRNNDDTNAIMRKVKLVDDEICVESFGIIYKKPSKKYKKKKKSSKDIKDLYQEQVKELEEMLAIGITGKDVNKKMYKLRSIIKGPKTQPQERMAINDPETGELITEDEEIKRVSLQHNVKILTKNKMREEDREEFKMKSEKHNEIMKKDNLDEWKLDTNTFMRVMEKAKEKNKGFYKLFNKAGESYKWAIFDIMEKIVKTEQIPEIFRDTSLIQIWKKKGSALDLKNMRFIHMRMWQSRLFTSLITEKIKSKVVEATPKSQLGGMPGQSSVDHLVTLKTWMKMLEERKLGGVFQCFDMEKFFDKESLLDVMYVMKDKAKIDDKSYRSLVKINDPTRISVKTSVGESKKATMPDSMGQGGPEAALMSSCSIGNGMKDTFKYEYSARIGRVGLNNLIFQDDIAKLNSKVEDAREGCIRIDETLKKKRLSVNYGKSKYIIFGDKKFKNKARRELEKYPMMMGNVKIEESVKEKYVGDQIHNNGCEQSITETIKERIQNSKRVVNEIIETCNNPLMDSLNCAKVPFNLFEAQVIPALLNNCESWIGIKDKHIKDLQRVQDEFIWRVLRISDKTTKAIINWDIGLAPMKWRIAERKLQQVRKTMAKHISNTNKQVLYAEVECKIKGLVYECTQFCRELRIPNLMIIERTKNEIKEVIKAQIKEEFREAMEKQKKVSDRLTDNPEDNSYIKILSLPLARVWFRYRARAIAGVKSNFKHSYNDLSCDFCSGNVEMTQTHLQEECRGTGFERRGLDMSDWRGVLGFWRRMTSRLSGGLPAAAAAPAPAAGTSTRGSSTEDPR